MCTIQEKRWDKFEELLTIHTEITANDILNIILSMYVLSYIN